MPLQSISVLEIRSSHIFRFELGVFFVLIYINENGYLAPFFKYLPFSDQEATWEDEHVTREACSNLFAAKKHQDDV